MKTSFSILAILLFVSLFSQNEEKEGTNLKFIDSKTKAVELIGTWKGQFNGSEVLLTFEEDEVTVGQKIKTKTVIGNYQIISSKNDPIDTRKLNLKYPPILPLSFKDSIYTFTFYDVKNEKSGKLKIWRNTEDTIQTKLSNTKFHLVNGKVFGKQPSDRFIFPANLTLERE